MKLVLGLLLISIVASGDLLARYDFINDVQVSDHRYGETTAEGYPDGSVDTN